MLQGPWEGLGGLAVGDLLQSCVWDYWQVLWGLKESCRDWVRFGAEHQGALLVLISLILPEWVGSYGYINSFS